MGFLQPWQSRWKRLTAMPRAELIERVRQLATSRYDYYRFRRGQSFVCELSEAAACPGKFFFAADDVPGLCEDLRRRLPEQVEHILEQAERVCLHRFDLLGYRDLQFGDVIDWRLDAVHGKRAPNKPFYKVYYLDFDEVGDSKVTWELNRHQHLVVLAKAYRLTGDSRYSEELLRQWEQWQVANPYSIGINWASSLEVAFRSLSWCWVYHLLDGTTALRGDFRRQWLRAQAVHGRHIETYLSTYFSPNTHLLGEAVALFFLGTLCPEIPSAERWKARGWEIILQEATRQVRDDGFHFEQSTYYHVYALDFFLHAALLAARNATEIPKPLESTLLKMFEALFLLGRNASPPSFGDDDGGRLFDPRRNQAHHLLDPLATGAVLFQRGDFKHAVGNPREEMFWLLGRPGLEEWGKIDGQHPVLNSSALTSTGLYVLTSPEASAQLTIDAGPQGAHSAGHGHADALSICLQSCGRSLLIDPGTFEYVGPGHERNLFRGTAMHSTLRVDGASQSEPAGPFSWHRLTHTRVDRWIQGESFDLFSGSHDGYAHRDGGVVHRRWVIALKSGLFLVRDLAEGEGRHRLDIPWHLGPEMFVESEHLFRVQGTQQGLAILPPQGNRWTEDVRKEQWSPAYGRMQFATVINFGVEALLPAELATVLAPLEEIRGVPGVLNRIEAEAQDTPVHAYAYVTEELEYQFFFSPGRGRWQCGIVSSDAEFICRVVAHRRRHENELLILCHGSYVELEGQRLLSLNKNVTRFESIARDGRMQTFCSEPEALQQPSSSLSPSLYSSALSAVPVETSAELG